MHEALEGGRGVGEAKGHDGVLKVAIPGTKGRLGYVIGVDANLVITMAKVDLGEHRGPVEAVKELINAWERVAVLNSDVVKATVVDAQAKGAILLADKEDGRAVRGGAGADVATREEGDELAFELGELLLRHRVDGAIGG